MLKNGLIFLSVSVLVMSIFVVVFLKSLNVNVLSHLIFGCKDPQSFGTEGLSFHACPLDNVELSYIFTDAVEYLERGEKYGITLTRNEDPVVLDVGANIGLVSYVVAKKYPKSKIYAFEPSPVVCDQLKENIKDHEIQQNVVALNIALSKEESEPVDFIHYKNVPPLSGFKKYEIEIDDVYIESMFKIFFHKCESGEIFPSVSFLFRVPIVKTMLYHLLFSIYYYSNVLLGYGEVEEFKVKVTTLENIVKEYKLDRIDLIVIDTEGAEWDILNGMPKKEDWKIVDSIIIEVHRNIEFDHDHYKSAKAITKFLEDVGFKVFVFDEAKVISERKENENFEFDLILYATKEKYL